MRDNKIYQTCGGPSTFSSTLLDAIYRSIDEPGGDRRDPPHHHRQQQQLCFYQETITPNQQGGASELGCEPKHRRAYMEEDWLEKKEYRKVTGRRNSDISGLRRNPTGFQNFGSTSSDSSSNKGGFSSSESDYSSRSETRSWSSSSCYSIKKLKPIRTSVSVDRPDNRPRVIDALGHKDDTFRVHKQEGGVVKAKSKALKIYGEFKRASGNNKLPISPGGKLASFLNSLFNAKKAKFSSGECQDTCSGKVPRSGYSSTCSSASSFSRSCLSKTSSSRGKFSQDGTKRSVRFCPVSVIIDEDCGPCGQQNVPAGDCHLPSSARKISLAKDQNAERLLPSNKYPERRETRGLIDDDDYDDDGASCASSDLFELENLSGIGIGGYRYIEELPVYETTNLDTNRAIANGLIV